MVKWHKESPKEHRYSRCSREIYACCGSLAPCERIVVCYGAVANIQFATSNIKNRAACIIQQKMVNLAKEINPEKKGSIYDMKFQDKWLENCDEAERFAVYKCSFKTFKTMQLTGMVLWLICLLGQMVFGTGAFATIIVAVFMIIQTSVYSVQGIYFAKHPSEVMK